MMKSLIIGLQGVVLNNDNLGCQALTYSLIRLLEDISKRNNIMFKYVIFEDDVPPDRRKMLMETFSLNEEQFQTESPCRWSYGKKLNTLRNIKHTIQNTKFSKIAKQCDVIIDMTQGDSFSDIYGKQRFYEWTHAKQHIEKMGIPLIIGPQTIGPFFDDEVRQIAKKVIDKAALVMSRDQKSADDVAVLTKKKIVIGTDVAFMLPYQCHNNLRNDKICIGINPSGLLCRDKMDSSEFNMPLRTDYDRYLNTLIDILTSDDKYTVHLIPHVGDEAFQFAKERTDCFCHHAFESPIEAKNCISEMDVFIGARMHATIAAFSSGVATIPTSYSPKFLGLYENIHYPYLVDLEMLETDTAVQRTLEYIKNADELRKAGKNSMMQIEEKYQCMMQELEKFLLQLYKESD